MFECVNKTGATTKIQKSNEPGANNNEGSTPGKNLPAVSDLPVLTGNGKLPKTAGLPDLPIGKPIQI